MAASLDRPYWGFGPRSRLSSSSEANLVSSGVISCAFDEVLTIRTIEEGEAVFFMIGRREEVQMAWPMWFNAIYQKWLAEVATKSFQE